IKDYLISNDGNEVSVKLSAPREFAKALIKSTCEGASKAVEDFIPSLCSSIHGMQTAIWAAHPLNPESLENAKSFVNACYEVGKSVSKYCEKVDWNTVEDCILEIRTL